MRSLTLLFILFLLTSLASSTDIGQAPTPGPRVVTIDLSPNSAWTLSKQVPIREERIGSEIILTYNATLSIEFEVTYEHKVEGMVVLAKGKCQRVVLHLKLTERVTFDVKITNNLSVAVKVTLSYDIKDTRPTVSDLENQISSLRDQISSLQSERPMLIGGLIGLALSVVVLAAFALARLTSRQEASRAGKTYFLVRPFSGLRDTRSQPL